MSSPPNPLLPIIAGHSHCSCLGVPLKTPDGVSKVVSNKRDPRFRGFSGAWKRTPKFWADLARHSTGRAVVLVWGGNDHNSHYLLAPGRPIDFVLHEEPELAIEPGADIAPDLAMHERFGAGMPRLEEITRALFAAGASRVVISGTPPPKGSSEMVRRGVMAEAHFVKLAEKLGLKLEEIPLTPPLIMYKMWRVMQRHLALAAARAGGEFLPVNPATQAGGFLRDDLAAPDATHANGNYGTLALEHIHAHLERPRG